MTRDTNIRRFAVLVTTAVLSLSSCAADDDPNPPQAVDGARPVDVTADALRFEPDSVELTANKDIALTLHAVDAAHDVTIDELDVHLHAEAGERQQAGLRIATAGTYTAYCSVPGHRAPAWR